MAQDARIDVGDRRARAERLAGYFELQLKLAETVAARTGEPLGEAVTRLTNLSRRLGLRGVTSADSPPDWAAFTAGLAGRRTTEARLAFTLEAFVAAPPEEPRPGQTPYGCFAHEPPDATGAVRIHFYADGDDGKDGTGPLARHKAQRRRAELAAMFAAVRERFPEASAVRGGSWLYNLEAYRRLFPPEFAESRPSPGTWELGGTSTWGQLIDHEERVRPEARDFFLARLPAIDPARPWEVFRLRALVTRAPIGAFTAFYACVEPSRDG